VALYLTINGTAWVVERRHEMAQLMLAGRTRERRLFLFFKGPDGELRRSEIAEDFPQEPPAALLVSVWRNAEVLRAGDPGEMVSHNALVVPTLRDTLRLAWRALRLRCPNCGQARVILDWFHLRTRCPACGLRLERGEDEDYYLGGMLFNILLAEGIFGVALLIALIVMWPQVPWTALQYVLVAAMIGAPIALYPVSRIAWLALDLLVRPPTPEEMTWHDANSHDDRDRGGRGGTGAG